MWDLKIENNIVYLKRGIRGYEIPLKNIISLGLINSDQNLDSRYQSEGYMTYRIINFKYIRNNKIESIKLNIKRKVNRRLFLNFWNYSSESYVDDEDVKILSEYFITNQDLKDKPELDLLTNYSYIRGNEENRIIEEMLEQKEKKLEKEINTNAKQALILLIVIIAMIIAAILPSMINR